jgi:predicted O-methyltransferase YrrM
MRDEIVRTLAELEEQREAQSSERSGAPAGGPRDRDKLMLAVGPDTGKLLNTLIQATGAKQVLEIGGSMGYSTVWQAEAVERNGGTLTTLEAVASKVEILRRRVSEGGLERTVKIIEGNALDVLPRLEGPFDFVLIDAWKADYPAYFDLVFPKLALGGLIVADNITRPAPPDAGITEYLRKARSHPEAQSQLLAVGSGLELTVKRRSSSTKKQE